jgi:tetratricopeptide (TPR) repeat protein
MFSFLAESKAAKEILAALEQKPGPDAFGALHRLPQERQVVVLLKVAERTLADRRKDSARQVLRRVVEIDPGNPDAWRSLARLEKEAGEVDSAREAYARYCEGNPDDADAACEYADILLDLEQPTAVVDLLQPVRNSGVLTVGARLAEALLDLKREPEALEILGPLRDEVTSALHKSVGRDEWHFWKDLKDEVKRLHERAISVVHGREQVVVESGLRHELKVRSGVNYRLLGLALIRKSELKPVSLKIQGPAEAAVQAKARLDQQPADATAMALLANAWQRDGRTSQAEGLFRKACDSDPTCFPAFLGLGAVIDDVDEGRWKSAQTLPPPVVSPELINVVADWEVLTDGERRVVWASVAPLNRYVPALSKAGVQIHVLPLDARATDHPLFADAPDRADDDRHHDSIRGMAQKDGAVVGIEELLDFFEPGNATFGHEFAHLVLRHLEERRLTEIKALYKRALDLGYVASAYASKNLSEFFAVSYADYLASVNGMPLDRVADEDGVLEATLAFFDSLKDG